MLPDYARTVHFKDTDAAGVVYFANILVICHEAYEYSLLEMGFDLKLFFSSLGGFVVPIVQAQADFLQPIFCGDRLLINVKPQQLDSYSFQVSYKVTNEHSRLLSIAQTKHICIHSSDRTKYHIPPELKHWIGIMNPA